MKKLNIRKHKGTKSKSKRFEKEIQKLPRKIVVFKQMNPPKKIYITFKFLWNGKIKSEIINNIK
jgi:hypothetical protein